MFSFFLCIGLNRTETPFAAPVRVGEATGAVDSVGRKSFAAGETVTTVAGNLVRRMSPTARGGLSVGMRRVRRVTYR